MNGRGPAQEQSRSSGSREAWSQQGPEVQPAGRRWVPRQHQKMPGGGSCPGNMGGRAGRHPRLSGQEEAEAVEGSSQDDAG